jgi:FLVCR family feline leukemia virus subgroup C receptor-related protein
VLLFAFGQIQGCFNTLGTIIGEAASQFKYSTNDPSVFGALFIVGGIVGSAVFGIWVEKTRMYKMAVFTICILSSTFSVAMSFIFKQNNDIVVSILCFFLGFSMVPIMAVAFDFGVEITYPIGESFSTGVLLSAG